MSSCMANTLLKRSRRSVRSSVTKIKILDASGLPGIPTLLSGAPETIVSAISTLTFSPDGEVHRHSNDMDSLNFLLYNLDLSYQLDWIGDPKVRLTRHGQELGTFLL